MTIYYFSGIAKWAKVHTPDPKYGNYTIDLFPDAKSMKAYKKSGLQLKEREDDEGNKFITFRLAKERKIGDEIKKQQPQVLDKDNRPMKDNIGNGSEVTCKVDIYETRDGRFGHRLLAVRADKLVEFKGNKVSEDTDIDVPF